MRKHFLKVLLLSLFAAPSSALADPVYTLTFLPADFHASALNDAGQVVGTAGGGAAIWSSTTVTYLAHLAPNSEGFAINDRGDVAGRWGSHAFVYAGGTVRDIDTGVSRSWATGINDAGTVTGSQRGNELSVFSRGFVYADGALNSIVTFGNYIDFANAINNAGQVAGVASLESADFGNPDRNAFLANPDGSTANLGSLGGRVSEANGLNDAGQVVGWSETTLANEERPFLYDGGEMMDLGSLGGRSGRANGINNAGMVVGMSDIGGSAGFDYHAFLYRPDGMVDLNTLIDPAAGWRLVSAIDINNAQQILGTACLGDSSDCRTVRLDVIPGVPEPGAWVMLLAGLALMACCKRRAGAPQLFAAPASTLRRLPKFLLLPLLASPLAAQADPIYMLQFAPGDFQAVSMNNAGRVIGANANGAAIWSDSGVTDIGAIAPGSFGRAINNRGDIGGGWNGDAFVYSSGSLRNIGRLGIWDSSEVTGMNDAGQVAGNGFYLGGERERGFVYSDGVVRNIPTFGGDWSHAAAINSSGQVAGIATIDSTEFFNPTRHAIMYQDRVTLDLGTLGGVISEAYDINDAGQIVGMSETTPDVKSDEPHAFLYQDGAMVDLGFLGAGIRALALGINSAGLVVGTSEWSDDPFANFHGFLFANDEMVDLNDLIDPATGWEIVSALDINDAQQILATACRSGECTTVRLDLVSAVPEPHVWGMLLAGLALMGSRRRRASPSEIFR